MPIERASPTNSALRSAHLPPRFLCLEHRLDIADPASARFRVAKGVLDDPVIDSARFSGITAAGALGYFARGIAHDPIGRHIFRGSEIAL